MGEIVEFGAVMTIVMAAVFSWKAMNVWTKRSQDHPKSARQLEDLEQRLADLEEWSENRSDAEARLTELEERVDFAERLLSAQRHPEVLPREDAGKML